MTKDAKRRREWEKENRVFIGLNLMKNTDEDILDYIEQKQKEGFTKQGIIKRSLRASEYLESAGYYISSMGVSNVLDSLRDPSPCVFDMEAGKDNLKE